MIALQNPLFQIGLLLNVLHKIMQNRAFRKLAIYLIVLCFLLNITDNAQWNSNERTWVIRANNIYQKIYYNYNKPFIQWTIRRRTSLATTSLSLTPEANNTLARVTFFDRNIKDKQNAFNSEDSDVSFDSWTNDWKHDATLDDPLSYFLYTSSTLTGEIFESSTLAKSLPAFGSVFFL